MELEIPYLRVRDFESQTLKDLLDKERPMNKPGSAELKPSIETEEAPRQTGFFPSDTYSKSVDLVLESIGLPHLIDKFRDSDVGVNILVHMDEDDLAEIGITDFIDQALFKKQLRDFQGKKSVLHRNVYKIEEDLIMAQNVLTHLEEINHHLSLVRHYFKINNFEDYFVNPKKSILSIFNIVMDRALIQTKKMTDVLFTGDYDTDELIPSLLKADELELPEFMTAKLLKPDKTFKAKPKEYNIKNAIIMAGLGACCTTLIFLLFRGKK